MRKLVLAALAALVLPAAASAAEKAQGWVIDFRDGNLRLVGDPKIYVVPPTIEESEALSEGFVAHLTYEVVGGQFVVQELTVNGTGDGSSD